MLPDIAGMPVWLLWHSSILDEHTLYGIYSSKEKAVENMLAQAAYLGDGWRESQEENDTLGRGSGRSREWLSIEREFIE